MKIATVDLVCWSEHCQQLRQK